MKKVVLIGLISASLSMPLFASKEIQCNPDGNQAELNVCAKNDYEAADNELNSVWKSLINMHKENKIYIEKIKISQNLWIKFRDAELDAKFACADNDMRGCWGSMYPLLRLSTLTSITKERTKRLQSYISSDPGLDEGMR